MIPKDKSPLDELWKESKVVSTHCQLSPQTLTLILLLITNLQRYRKACEINPQGASPHAVFSVMDAMEKKQ